MVKRRTEPRFDDPRKSFPDIRVDASDRVVGGAPKGRAAASRKDPVASKPIPAERSAGSGNRKAAGASSSRRGNGNKGGKNGGGWFGFARRFAYWCLVLGLWGSIAIACVVGYYAAQLPSMSAWKIPDRAPNVRIVAGSGQLLANRGVTGGESLRLDEMSPWLPKAVVAIEDRRFHAHFGIDPLGLARAMFTNAISGRLVQGGSTLSQQLAKNLFLEPDRTLGRKVQEAVLAIWLERRFSKDEILELYLNRVYFGSGAYGVDAAARRYFNKSARDLNLLEAATIAGLVKAPTRLSPARDPQAARERAELVLGAMQREAYISGRDAENAMTLKPEDAKRYWSGARHYAADMAMKQVVELIGDINADLIVDTTIDMALQDEAEAAIRTTLEEQGEKLVVGQGALVAMEPDGALRAIVGGREYAQSQFNRATDAKRQPGSAFKPFVYLAAVEAGNSPETVRRDAPVRIGKWTPENYDRKYRGPMTLADALAASTNTIAAQLTSETGPRRVIETAQRLGIGSPLENNASIALGTSEVSLLELTSAFAPFANGGNRAEPWMIRRIMTVDGKVLFERSGVAQNSVLGPRELGMMNAMLKGVVERGTGKKAQLRGWEVAGKTGTTQNSRDAWFIGYTAQMVTGVWFGNDDNSPMKGVTGGSLPAVAWERFMQSAMANRTLASLPGRYEPQEAVMENLAQDRAGGGTTPPGLVSNDHDPQTGGDTAAQPRKRPRSILDLLFGRSG